MMSTFGGLMSEFPDIRVDYFRPVAGLRPPLAAFLSHVHSDHLSGLDNLKAPFIYCSAATKELLIRLERKFHRINFQNNILETYDRQYKHLKNLLRPIPLETPTKLELSPGNEIQVTLFDANHCTGAVMFLFENDKNAVLYTGDMRSEPWFVNNLLRNPLLIEYTTGLKILDCIYLDTSFTSDMEFPTKAEGLKELLEKVATYPPDTVFHFASWTFGYEEVWIALSRALKSPIHVDRYKLGLYQALRGDSKNSKHPISALSYEASSLVGHKCGNSEHPGVLTLDDEVRLHTCEKGTPCQINKNPNIVWIRPIITRVDGKDVAEMGIGGGGGDLTRRAELEIDSMEAIQILVNELVGSDALVIAKVRDMVMSRVQSDIMSLSWNDFEIKTDDVIDYDDDELSLAQLAHILVDMATKKHKENTSPQDSGDNHSLPNVINFPYSRHSSYSELCHLVGAFTPKDVYPCTVDEHNWDEDQSIETLFGKFCSGRQFRHDIHMKAISKNHKGRSTNEEPVATGHSLTQEAQEGRSNMLLRRLNEEDLIRCDMYDNEIKASSGIEDEPKGSTSNQNVRQDVGFMSSPVPSHKSVRRKSPDDLDDNSPGCKRQRLEGDIGDCDSSDIDEVSSSGDSYDYISGHLSQDWPDGFPDVSYWDNDDDVYRCVLCSHEMWTVYGLCSGCDSGEIPYFEDTELSESRFDDQEEKHPRLFLTEYEDCEDMDHMTRRCLTAQYLDGPSGYESDEDKEAEEYEINSFIDDASIQSEEETDGDSTSNDDDSDYKRLYLELQAKHSQLWIDYAELHDEHDELQKGFLGSDYGLDDSANDDSIYDGDDVLLAVDVETKDPAIVEVIPSDSQMADSQGAALGLDRIASRVESYDATLGGEWESVPLVSVRDNHAAPEVQL